MCWILLPFLRSVSLGLAFFSDSQVCKKQANDDNNKKRQINTCVVSSLLQPRMLAVPSRKRPGDLGKLCWIQSPPTVWARSCLHCEMCKIWALPQYVQDLVIIIVCVRSRHHYIVRWTELTLKRIEKNIYIMLTLSTTAMCGESCHHRNMCWIWSPTKCTVGSNVRM